MYIFLDIEGSSWALEDAREGAMLLAEITWENFSATLDEIADDLLDEASMHGPPVDALALAARLGIAVAWDADQRGRGRYVRLRGHAGRRSQPRPAILLRPEPRAEREHWIIAHEIGEHVAHRVFAALGVDPAEAPTESREKVVTLKSSRVPGP